MSGSLLCLPQVRPDGSILEGTFEHGLLHGFGRTVDAHGMAQEGEWFHGELQGI